VREIPLEGGPVRLMGALDLDRRDTGITPRRLPDWTRPQVPVFMEVMVTMPSGVRLEFATTSPTIELEVLLTRLELLALRRAGGAAFDLAIDGDEIRTQRVTGGNKIVMDLRSRDSFELVEGEASRVRFEGLPARNKHCELWLPPNAAVELRALRVDDGAEVRAVPVRARRRWVHHGSSISHCSEAHSPTRTWPAVAARLADLDLLNLGLGGNCHLDPFVARAIRDEQADAISLKLGINVVNLDTLKERTFAPALHGFLDTIREGKPDTPILVVSPIICPSAEDRPGPTVLGENGAFVTIPGHDEVRAGSLSLRRIREILATAVDLRRSAGDRNLHYLDGLQLFGRDDVGDLPDALHPNGDGYVRMGERFASLAFGARGSLAA
jgi:hypothetical protein